MNRLIFASILSDEINDTIADSMAVVPPSGDISSGVYTTAYDVDNLPTDDFVIVYPTHGSIPGAVEVDYDTLSIKIGSILSIDESGVELDIIETYGLVNTLQFVKLGTVPGQRSVWRVTQEYEELPPDDSTVFTDLLRRAKDMLTPLGFTFDSTEITAPANEMWTIQGVDDLQWGESQYPTPLYNMTKEEAIKNLASKCAENRGFEYPEQNEVYPNYLIPNGVAISSLNTLTTLRFATNRKSAKTRDEWIWQNVYILSTGDQCSVCEFFAALKAQLEGTGGE